MATLSLMMCFFLILITPSFASSSTSIPQTYIILVKPKNSSSTSSSMTKAIRDNWYASFLPNQTSTFITSRIIRTYTDAINGFAAMLTAEELNHIKKNPNFLTAIPNRKLHLSTTHSSAYLGLDPTQGFWNASGFGSGVIIGLLDTGIHPAHPSFSDQGMSDPPTKWKGVCEFNYSGACNKKLIGARFLINGVQTIYSEDTIGHGTHTSATAAGAFVPSASILGSASGTAAGLAPLAHLAMYKVCNDESCDSHTVMAGIDYAISDGVDVISLSLGEKSANFFSDEIAIGAFKAIKNGIFVSCAAGNGGPSWGTLENDAPWLLTVGASTTDRRIRTTVILGNGEELDGESAYQPKSKNLSSPVPLILPSGKESHEFAFTNCSPESLQATDIRGKAVLCLGYNTDPLQIGRIIKEAGGAALIIGNPFEIGDTTFAQPHVLPASHVSYTAGIQIKEYIDSTANPMAAIIFKGTVLGVTPAPTVASFSSRGPSKTSPGILKPDITAPGVNVLAAWPYQVEAVSEPSESKTSMNFNLVSGTSMSTPHLSGIAALLKSVHRDWSPAAIKSALMTTADPNGNDSNPINDERNEPAFFYSIGAGLVNPTKAADPGLIYNLTADDYTPYLCGLGYTNEEVEAITGTPVSCEKIEKINEAELNYPSILVFVPPDGIEVSRVVTNVGKPVSSYKMKLEMPENVEVSVKPEMLKFTMMGETQKFTVKIKMKNNKISMAEGSLKWVSDEHVVRSSVVMRLT